MTRRNLISGGLFGLLALCGWKPVEAEVPPYRVMKVSSKWLVETTNLADGCKRTFLGGGWDGPHDIIENSGVPRVSDAGPHTVTIHLTTEGLWRVEAVGECSQPCRSLSIDRDGIAICSDCGRMQRDDDRDYQKPKTEFERWYLVNRN